MNFRIDGCVMTNPGKVRSNNEDNYNLFGTYRDDVDDYIRTVEMSAPEGYALAAVLDGMGGESAGEIASIIAASNISACPLDQVTTTGLQQILTANQKVCEETVKRGGKRMGTTYVGAYIENGKFMVANVGDSRCYMLRNSVLTLLSKDHSMGQRMIDSGVMTEAEARKSKSWHELTQHFGIFPEEFTIEPYFTGVYDFMDGDELLLCSDGLTDMMGDSEIAAIISVPAPIKDKVNNLLNAALEKGGRDNVTVMIIRAVALTSDEETAQYDAPMAATVPAPVVTPVSAPAAAETVSYASASEVAPIPTSAIVPEATPIPAPVAVAVPEATPISAPVAEPAVDKVTGRIAPEQQYVEPLASVQVSDEEVKLQKSIKALTIVMIVLIVAFVGLAAFLLYLLLF